MFVVLGEVVLSEETSGNTLSSIRGNLDKPADDDIDDNHQDNIVPPGEARQSAVDIDMSQKISESSQENWSHEVVVFHGVVASHKRIAVKADAVALPGRVAEGKTWKSDVTVGVSTDQTEANVKESLVVAGLTDFVAASVSVASEKLNDKSGDLEEAVDEWATDDAAPVTSDESHDGGMPFSLVVVPVPVSSTTRHAEVD